MNLSRNSFILLNLSVYSLFVLVIFKPTSEEGRYAWINHPTYVLLLLKLIFLVTISIFFISSAIFLLKNFRKIKFSKIFLILSSLFLISVLFTQLVDYFFNGQSFIDLIFKTIFFLIYFLIFNIYTQMKLSSTFYLLPISLTGSIFILLNMLLLLFDPGAVWPESIHARMYGTTNHPNFFAVTCAIIFVSSLEVYKNFNELNIISKKFIKHNFFIFITLLAFLGIIFSGSRTGLFFISIYFFFKTYSNLKKITYLNIFLLLLSAVFMILVIINLDTFIDSFTNIKGLRITNTESNRTGAWDNLIETFLNNPLFGVGIHNLIFSENSYLRSLAGSGLISSIFFFLFIFFISIYSLLNLRSNLNKFTYLIMPLIIAAYFEAFLTDMLSYQIVTFLYSACCIINLNRHKL